MDRMVIQSIDFSIVAITTFSVAILWVLCLPSIFLTCIVVDALLRLAKCFCDSMADSVHVFSMLFDTSLKLFSALVHSATLGVGYGLVVASLLVLMVVRGVLWQACTLCGLFDEDGRWFELVLNALPNWPGELDICLICHDGHVERPAFCCYCQKFIGCFECVNQWKSVWTKQAPCMRCRQAAFNNYAQMVDFFMFLANMYLVQFLYESFDMFSAKFSWKVFDLTKKFRKGYIVQEI